jgi:hypothetical protein
MGVLGVAPVNSVPPVLGEATMRYGAGLWNPHDVRESTNTAVHEVGHSQGSLHTDCGGAADPDPAYPHPGAIIGVRGLDPLTAQFYDPMAYHDFMSYCRPYWVSDFQFTKNYGVLTVLTSFAGADMQPVPTPTGYTGVVLTGVVQPEGETRWWINHNAMPPEVAADSPLRLGLQTPAGEFELPADVRLLGDMPGARLVTVPLVHELEVAEATDILSIQVRGEGVHAELALHVAEPRIADRRNIEFRHTGFRWDLTAR